MNFKKIYQLSARGVNSGTLQKMQCCSFFNEVLATKHAHYIGECGIPFLESQRDLGVTVSGTLSWSQQCDTVCSKAYIYGALYVLRINVHTTSSITIKKQLSLVKSSIS